MKRFNKIVFIVRYLFERRKKVLAGQSRSPDPMSCATASLLAGSKNWLSWNVSRSIWLWFEPTIRSLLELCSVVQWYMPAIESYRTYNLYRCCRFFAVGHFQWEYHQYLVRLCHLLAARIMQTVCIAIIGWIDQWFAYWPHHADNTLYEWRQNV